MGMLVLIVMIIIAFYFGWRMNRLEEELEEYHDSLRKILALPVELRGAELKTHLEEKKQQAARQRRSKMILGWAAIGLLLILAALGILSGCPALSSSANIPARLFACLVPNAGGRANANGADSCTTPAWCVTLIWCPRGKGPPRW